MLVPLETHYGTWQDPVVRFELLTDLVFLAVTLALLTLLIARYHTKYLQGSTHRVGLAVLSLFGFVLTVGFLIPILNLPGGALFRLGWPGTAQSVLVSGLGFAPGTLGAYGWWRIRREFTDNA